MGLAVYRKGQGKIVRTVSLVSLAALLFLGCYQLYGFLVQYSWGNEPLAGVEIPVVRQPFNVAIIASVLVFAGVALGVYLFLNRKASVDLLVETETELKKVTWPSWPETLNSSIIVIIAVAVIAVYLALADFVLGNFFGFIL
jgi:preprotein translocase SecE subunit